MADKYIRVKVQGTKLLPYQVLEGMQGNLKRLSDEGKAKLKQSILINGICAPVFIWKGKNRILDGHTRLHCLKELINEGYKLETAAGVPIVEIEADTEKEAAQYILVYNSQYGEITKEGLTEFIEQFELNRQELQDMVKFLDMGKLNSLLKPKEERKKEDDIPEPPKIAKTKLGDIWQLGDHRIICGNATNREDIEKLMLDKRAQAVITDPPYGVSYVGVNNPNGKAWDMIENDHLRGDDLFKLLYESFKNYNEFTDEQPALYIFYASINQGLFQAAVRQAGLKDRQQLIWAKGHVLGHSDYHWAHEPIIYATKEKRAKWYADRTQKSVLLDKSDEEIEAMKKEELIGILKAIRNNGTILRESKGNVMEYEHPTQKPVKLYTRMIENSTQIGDTIIDFFAGSGTAIIAAEITNRRAYCAELDPIYVDVCVKRWCEYTNKDAYRLSDGKTWKELEIEENIGELKEALIDGTK